MTDPHVLLAEAEALAAKASRGPWAADPYALRRLTHGDAAFIAASRTLVPALCAALRQALAENERLRALIPKETSDDR